MGNVDVTHEPTCTTSSCLPSCWPRCRTSMTEATSESKTSIQAFPRMQRGALQPETQVPKKSQGQRPSCKDCCTFRHQAETHETRRIFSRRLPGRVNLCTTHRFSTDPKYHALTATCIWKQTQNPQFGGLAGGDSVDCEGSR